MKKIVALLLFFLSYQGSFAQENSENLTKEETEQNNDENTEEEEREPSPELLEARKLIDKGNLEEAIKLLEEVKRTDRWFKYEYEIGYAYLLAGEFEKAEKTLKNTLSFYADADGSVYHLLGKVYKLQGKIKKMKAICEKGVKRFPKTGKLYESLGQIDVVNGDYDRALMVWKAGMENDPKYTMNYYHFSHIILKSPRPFYGLIFGELFMNINRTHKRTKEISFEIYNGYKDALKITPDSTYVLDLGKIKKDSASVEDFESQSIFLMNKSLKNIKRNSKNLVDKAPLYEIIQFRIEFLDHWFGSKGSLSNYNETYPNLLFEYLQQIKNAGHLEAYHYWLFMDSDRDTLGRWYAKNKDKWNAFFKWFQENPIEITDETTFFILPEEEQADVEEGLKAQNEELFGDENEDEDTKEKPLLETKKERKKRLRREKRDRKL